MVLGELSRVSRPCSPLDQEKALKAGWLKRQRSIMKNWQLRWFVLKTEALYFYKDQDETKAQVMLTTTTKHKTVNCCHLLSQEAALLLRVLIHSDSWPDTYSSFTHFSD